MLGSYYDYIYTGQDDVTFKPATDATVKPLTSAESLCETLTCLNGGSCRRSTYFPGVRCVCPKGTSGNRCQGIH